MPYPGERSNPLGLKGFLDDLKMDHYKELLAELEELYREVEKARRVPLDEVDEVGENYPLLTLTVDGGEGLAFEELPLLSFGLVRIAAVGVNGFRLPSISHLLPGYAVLKDPRKYLEDLLARSRESPASDALNTFFQATGISLEDLGEHYAKDLKAFVGVFRDVLEWAYLVWVVEKVLAEDYRKYLFVKDGRLAQTGVKDEFRTKLRVLQEERSPSRGGLQEVTSPCRRPHFLSDREALRRSERGFFAPGPGDSHGEGLPL